MEKEEIRHLQYLLGKLSRMLGARFCLIPDYVQDLFYIATFDSDGKKVKEVNGLDLEDALDKLKNTNQ